MTRAEQAMENFLSGYNCAQAVAVAFSDLVGVSQAQMARMASCFGGGMGRMREVCGAVSGMLLITGMLYGYATPGDDEAKRVLYTRVQDLAGQFQAETGSLICRDILKNPPSDPNPTPRTAAFYATRPCARMVYAAARILEEELEKNPPEQLQ